MKTTIFYLHMLNWLNPGTWHARLRLRLSISLSRSSESWWWWPEMNAVRYPWSGTCPTIFVHIYQKDQCRNLLGGNFAKSNCRVKLGFISCWKITLQGFTQTVYYLSKRTYCHATYLWRMFTSDYGQEIESPCKAMKSTEFLLWLFLLIIIYFFF